MWMTEDNIVEVPFDKEHLLEVILDPSNLNRAYKSVMRNKGCGGIDGMSCEHLLPWLLGSKITFGGDDNSEFIPTNLRLGTSLMIPVDEYNRFSISADANKLLVPTYPKQNEGESTEDYQERVQKDYYDISSINGIFKSFGDAPNGFLLR